MGAIMCGGSGDIEWPPPDRRYRAPSAQPSAAPTPSNNRTPSRTPRKPAIKPGVPALGVHPAAGRSSDWRAKPVRHVSFFSDPAPTTRNQLLGCSRPTQVELIQPNTKLVVSEQAELCLIEGADAIVDLLARIYDSFNNAANKIALAELLVEMCTIEADVANSSPILLDSDYSTALQVQLERIATRIKDVPSIDAIEEHAPTDSQGDLDFSCQSERLTIQLLKGEAEERIHQRKEQQKQSEAAAHQVAAASIAVVAAPGPAIDTSIPVATSDDKLLPLETDAPTAQSSARLDKQATLPSSTGDTSIEPSQVDSPNESPSNASDNIG